MHLVVDRASPITLTDQLFAGLKRLMLDGGLAEGERLPPSRTLAMELGVSRTVTVEVFERLAAEGFVVATQGSGTFVASGARLAPAPRTGREQSPALSPVGFEPLRSDIIDFRTGVPELRLFPIRLWQRLAREVWERLTPRDLAYSAPEGRPELRAAIAAYLRVHRGVVCDPDQIVVTSGTTQAVAVLGSALASGGRTVVVEDPVTNDIPRILKRSGAAPTPVPLDGEGIQVERLPVRPIPAFVYITPSHHYPLGIAMPIGRRTALIGYARRTGAYLVEDDYDSEFRYGLPPVSTLFELDPERVIYIGTFSKTLAPALRTAFIVAPWPVVRCVREAKWHADLHNASPEQLVLARFIREGHYARHLARMQKIYQRKWRVLREALVRELGDSVTILGSPAGMHVAARFRGVRFTPKLLAAFERQGVKVYPVALHAAQPKRWAGCLAIGFGHLSEEQIDRGVAILARTLHSTAGLTLTKSTP